MNLWVERKRASIKHLLEHPNTYLTNCWESRGSDGIKISGQVENYKVFVSEKGVALKGSIARFKNGANFNTLNPNELKEAIAILSDKVALNLEKAKVTRIDCANNLLMMNKPELYYPCLGEVKRYKRTSDYYHTLYYKGQYIKLSFYNKATKDKKDIPVEHQGKNILRYERGLMKPEKLLNRFGVTPVHLYDERLYKRLLIDYKKQYDAIPKVKNIFPRPSCNIQPREIINLFALQFIKELGGYHSAIEYVNSLDYRMSEHKSRARKQVSSLFDKKGFTFESPLIVELDNKMDIWFSAAFAA